MKELYVVVNEKISNKNKSFFCENKDIQSIVNYLSVRFNLFVFSRYGKFQNYFKINNCYKVINFRLINIFYFLTFFFNLNKKKKY